MRSIELGGKTISDDSDCFVIAEIGNNHQGDVEVAKEMFRVAADCGADAVKLQTRDNRALFTEAGYNAPYDNENSFGATYGKHRDYLEFDTVEYHDLALCADELGIDFFSTPFDFASAEFLANVVPFFKIASGDLRNTPFLDYVASFNRPMIVSTGGSTIADVLRAYETIARHHEQIVLLQCTASYPAEFRELNLRVIETYRGQFPDTVVGLSSHDNGIAMATAAYVLGARVIEKHFTLNHTMKGTDHAFSLEPPGFKKMVRDLKRARVAMGDGFKRVYASEIGPITKMSKKLVAAGLIKSGHTIERDDIALKSPGDGTQPYELEFFVGAVAKCDILKDEDLTTENAGWC